MFSRLLELSGLVLDNSNCQEIEIRKNKSTRDVVGPLTRNDPDAIFYNMESELNYFK